MSLKIPKEIKQKNRQYTGQKSKEQTMDNRYTESILQQTQIHVITINTIPQFYLT